MECKDMRELIIRYSAGDLTEPETGVLEAHIALCAECGTYLKRSDNLWHLLDNVEEVEPAENYVSRFWDKVDKQEASKGAGFMDRLRGIRLNWAFAGALATICIVSLFTFAIIRDDFKSGTFSKSDIQDEQILEDLDVAIASDTSDVLAIYGPWESANNDNNGGMN